MLKNRVVAAQVAGSFWLAAALLIPGNVEAGATFKIDDTKWLSIGAGLRTSFSSVENSSGINNNKWGADFNLDNIRLYLNGQIHEYIKLEFNTDCDGCSDGGNMFILDAIAKFEFTDYANIWIGRQLVPAHRAELDGPFYQNVYEFDATPFYPQDFGSFTAGKFGRDDGINFWGALGDEKRFTYVLGVFDGLNNGANSNNNPLFAGRVSYNFLEVEKNPGYYTSSTYYGKGGDILTLAYAIQYEQGGAGSPVGPPGSAIGPANFLGMSTDLLFEKVLGNQGVVTVEGEYKYFSLTELSRQTLASADCFCLFEGHAYTGTALYLIPDTVGIGQFQPYVRYTYNDPQNSSSRWQFEAGTNYVIDGHNARISLFYQYGDIATKGRVWTPGVTGDKVSAIKLGVQLQL
ncbi:MAG: hypothetical protein ACU843_08280 [Gammaproteobacteria bacterium]